MTVTMLPERDNSLRTRLGDFDLEKSLVVSKYTVEILFRFFNGLNDLNGLTGELPLELGEPFRTVVPRTGRPDLDRRKLEFRDEFLGLPIVNLVLAPTVTVTSWVGCFGRT